MITGHQENGNVRHDDGQVTNPAQRVAQRVIDIVSQTVGGPTEQEQAQREQLAQLELMRIATQTVVEPEEYSLSVDGVGIFALGDIHAIKGSKKSGKSAALKVLAAAMMSGQQFRAKSELEEGNVLFLDTEQQAADVRLIIDEVRHLSGQTDDYIDRHLWLYTLRRRNYETLMADTRLLVATHRPQLVFIDGVVDYVCSFNDEELSRKAIRDLMLLSDEYHCATVCVLHTNKSKDDDNMRGHLGTELANRAGNVLECMLSERGIITVASADARHGKMPAWHICFDSGGHICQADTLQEEQARERQLAKAEKAAEQRAEIFRHRLDTALDIIRTAGGRIKRTQLQMELAKRLEVSETTAKKFVRETLGQQLHEFNGNIYDSELSGSLFRGANR